MRSATFYSDSGVTVSFNNSPPFYFKGPLGDTVGATAESVKPPRSAGQQTAYVSLDKRTISLSGQVLCSGSKEKPVRQMRDYYKSLLGRAFLPSVWGLLVYHTEEGGKQIRCRAIASPTFSETESPLLMDVSVNFESDSALWESSELYTATIGGFKKRFYFPWSPRALPMGTYIPRTTIYNDWVEEIYPDIEVYSTSMFVTITNETTGEFLTINHAIEENQKLTIDMDEVYAVLWELEGDKYVEVDDVSNWLTAGDPWGLVPGGNVIHINNENPNDTPVAYISYRQKYGAV